MARIELRHTNIVIRDGLAGEATVNQMMAPMEGDSSLTINNIDLNTDIPTKVPVGARFTIAGETDTDTVHIVTARTQDMMDPDITTAIQFSPPLGPGMYLGNGDITFQPQEIDIKIGDGDLRYTEADEYLYDLDRGELDTVRKGDDQPMQVVLNFVYEHITTGTDEVIAPMDAIKRRGAAAEWVSASADKCEPYAVDLVVRDERPCVTGQKEITTFPDFRADQKEISLRDANIAVTGRCNATEPIVQRV